MRLVLILAAASGVLATDVPPLAAQAPGFRDPSRAPPSWMQFAKLVKFRFEEWIAADDRLADRFRAYVRIHRGAPDGPPASLTVRVWINPDGSVEKVSFPSLGDAGATEDLRRILTHGNVGEAPPPEMLQPLHLRLSLNVK